MDPGKGNPVTLRVKTRAMKDRNGTRRRPASGWVAVGALAACTAMGSGRLASAAAPPADGGGLGGGSAPQSQLPVRRFEIPAGTLETVLAAFQAASGVSVSTPPSIRGLASPGVSGDLTPEQALRRLLEGTGVHWTFSGPGAVTLVLRVLESVLVIARASAPSSPKYTQPLVDVPQTIAVIPRAVIEEQGATTLRDVLQNVPGLTIQAGEGGAPAGDNLTLRGFSARNDIFVDGVRDLGPQTRDTFNLEQVEVTKGPQTAYTGRGSTGGTINLVNKAPSAGSFYGGTLALGTDATRRVTADVNRTLRQGIAFRMNVMGHDADVAARNAVENRRWGVAPSLAVGLGSPTRLTASYFHLQQDNLSDYGIPWVTATHDVLAAYRNRPAPVPRETFYGLRSRDHEDLRSDLGTLKLERDFGPSTRLRSQLRYGLSRRDSMATPPRFASDDSTVINREMRSWIADDEIWDNQTDLTLSFETGEVQHALITGLQLSSENNVRRIRTAPNMPTTLLDPDPDDVYPGVITTGPNVGDVTGKSVGVYAFDTLSLGSRVELSGGLRYDYFDVDGVTTAPAPVSRVDRMLSGRAGVVFKPRPHGSVYAAYGTSFNPSLEGLSYGTANAAIEPEKTYTFELGSKWELAGERLLVSGALFSTDKTNARTPGLTPDDPPQVLEGEQRVRGLELGATGSLTRRWTLFAAYTFLDSEILSSNTPAEVGKELVNVPRNALSVWTTYELPWRLAVGGGVRFIDRRYGNTTNTRRVESYWIVDAMASYPVTRRLSLRLNLYNLNDVYFFERLGGGHLIPGAGRSAMVSTSLGF
jgi:catecholate siderophore receptor